MDKDITKIRQYAFLGLIFTVIGYGLLWYYFGFVASLSIFFIQFGDSLKNKVDTFLK